MKGYCNGLGLLRDVKRRSAATEVASTAAQAAQTDTEAASTAAQVAQTATNAAFDVIGSKTFEYRPKLVAPPKPATVPTTTPTVAPTVAPSYQPAQPKTLKDYLLWIALGGVVAFGAYKMLTGGKKKRR